jgi:hypothetical protein
MLTRETHPLQFVIAGLVQEIAETDHAHGFADEVYRQSRRREAGHANHRIQFLSSALQVGASHPKSAPFKAAAATNNMRFWAESLSFQEGNSNVGCAATGFAFQSATPAAARTCDLPQIL